MSKSETPQLNGKNREVVEALHCAIEVLDAESSDTEGSGHDALTKCRKALNAIGVRVQPANA